jgi:hypothetical protein
MIVEADYTNEYEATRVFCETGEQWLVEWTTDDHQDAVIYYRVPPDRYTDMHTRIIPGFSDLLSLKRRHT